MDGDKRRKEIMELLNTEKDPLSGTSLAKRLGVSLSSCLPYNM